ncbi:aminotransferase class-V [Klosneuvirus KNV1]|uniref:NifS-like protein n=1 Tax=Klosneuvirus KNV1 TaxID=1977640 RepID=A0A1V0SL42_9VIRU|nr:aminotransferase class-V [Klosneuvirus KNV1]
MNLINIPEKIKNNLVYKEPIINTPLRNNVKIIFADFTASGRPSPLIEKYLSDNIYPYYSNTHSNSYCGIMMKQLLNETKDYIRKVMNIDKSKKIIFSGSGTTSAINHLVYCLQLDTIKKVNIFLSPLEHHSNFLPWSELANRKQNINLTILPIDDNYDLDLKFLEEKIKETDSETINIVSTTSCSNVLGIVLDTKKIYDMLQKYNVCECCYGKKNLLFIDYACSAPYIQIDGRYSDALYFSPHKFLGGPGTPGVLIANKELFNNKTPYEPGGGCVKKVDSKSIEYDNDIEKRESAGTPDIIGIIKIKKVLQVKKFMFKYIEQNEHEISKYVFCQFKKLSQKYPQLLVILPECHIENRLPIVCIAIKDIHYNLIVALLSDLFAIMTRGGHSCTGLLAEIIKKNYKIDGWCRISFNWLHIENEINYTIKAVEHILNNINELKNYYTYDSVTNLFTYKN